MYTCRLLSFLRRSVQLVLAGVYVGTIPTSQAMTYMYDLANIFSENGRGQ